jgi:hypothetical protein
MASSKFYDNIKKTQYGFLLNEEALHHVLAFFRETKPELTWSPLKKEAVSSHSFIPKKISDILFLKKILLSYDWVGSGVESLTFTFDGVFYTVKRVFLSCEIGQARDKANTSHTKTSLSYLNVADGSYEHVKAKNWHSLPMFIHQMGIKDWEISDQHLITTYQRQNFVWLAHTDNEINEVIDQLMEIDF